MAKNNDQSSGIRPGVIVAIIAVVGILIAGKFLGWYGGGKSTSSTGAEPVPEESATTATAREGTPPSPLPEVRPGTPARPNQTPPGAGKGLVATATPGSPGSPNVAGVAPVPVELPTGGVMLKEGEWEQKLDDILGSNEDEKQKAEKLLQMFPLLPEDGQVEISQHLSNLLEDDRYSALAPTFTNPATPEAVLDVLMADVLNRNNTIKLNTLLDVARTANHPKAEEAREVLEVFVDENFGDDWAKWQAAIQSWLKENPDEPEETGKTPPPSKDAPAAPAVK
jgi:hypothetical protein